MKKAIGCIGQGFVGGSLTTVFAEHGLTVYTLDKLGKQAVGGKYPNSEVANTSIEKFVQACEAKKEFSGVYFVCVPTPMRSDGSADLSIVESVLNDLNSVDGHRIAVVKSTVPPGSTARWNVEYSTKGRLSIVFCPEFLTEANALDDMRNQTRIILGGPRPYINTVKQIFQSAFPKVPIVKTSSTTAEMVKYTTNCFLATKVSFANEIAQICEALDTKGMNVDYDKVVEYSKLDKRLGDSHWAVPGPVATEDGRYVRGFGGHCFPKDINALIFVANNMGLNTTVLSAVWQKNLELRPPEDRDWEKMGGRAVSEKSVEKSAVYYWSKVNGHFVNTTTGKLVDVKVSGQFTHKMEISDREWCETLIEVCIDAGNNRAKNLVKGGQTSNLFNKFPIMLLTNSKVSEYLKSSVLFKENQDISGVSTGQVVGTIGSMFKIICDDCIADDVIHVGDYAEIYICDTSDQVRS